MLIFIFSKQLIFAATKLNCASHAVNRDETLASSPQPCSYSRSFVMPPSYICSSRFSPKLAQKLRSIVSPSPFLLLLSSHSSTSKFCPLIHQVRETMLSAWGSAPPCSMDQMRVYPWEESCTNANSPTIISLFWE